MSDTDGAGAQVDWEALRDLATKTRANAHAPYSGFAVGAAVRADDGRVFVGVNVENASYGLTACAERNALSAAVAAGARRFVALAVVGPESEPPAPCGACRQVLSEFPPAFEVRSYGTGGAVMRETTATLLPRAFVLVPPR
jgi:cytidine deaminase